MRGVVKEAHVSAGDARLHGLLGRFDDIGSLQRLLGSVLNGLLGLAAEVEQSYAQAGLRMLLVGLEASQLRIVLPSHPRAPSQGEMDGAPVVPGKN